MADDALFVGDQLDDLHLEVGKRLAERTDPTLRGGCELPVGEFLDQLDLAAVDRFFREASDERLLASTDMPG